MRILNADVPRIAGSLLAAAVVMTATAAEGRQTTDPAQTPPPAEARARRAPAVLRFLGGAALALGIHEGAHVSADLSFGATPRVKRVDFHGIPFFAITPEGDLSRRQQFVIASAGFWAQHAGSEWILSQESHLRDRSAPLRKGMLAFNVLASAAYAGAAFARTGPHERDTLGMADGARMDERAIGALLLAPAVLDTVRYYKPGAKWATWASRGVKIGLVVLVVR